MLRLTPEEEATFRDLNPHVRFQMPSELPAQQFYTWIKELLQNFLDQEGPTSLRARLNLNEDAGMEGSLSSVRTGNLFIDYCKLFWHDGESLHCWKGLLFYNHSNMGPVVTRDIYIIADKFEEFLRSQEIPYERFAMVRKSHGESLQSKYPDA